MFEGNVPAQDIESEKALIGCLLLDPSRTMSILQARGCTDEWFYHPETRTIYEACIMALMMGSKIDPVLIRQYLPADKRNSDITITAAHWCDLAVLAHALFYANNLKAKHELRKIHETCSEAIHKIKDVRGSTSTFVSELRHKLSMIPSDLKQISTMDMIINNARKIAEEAKASGSPNIQSRWFRLQRAYGGYPRGKITLVGARPAQGKSTFVNNETTGAALRGIPTAVISMEMTSEEWMINAICAEAGLDANKFKDGGLDWEEMERYKVHEDRLLKAPLYVTDQNQTIGSMCSFMRDMATDKKCELIAFDYLGMIKPESGHRSKQEEVASISNSLTTLAKELTRTAIIGVCQLNRAPQGEKNQEPEMHHLRDSGCLEQDAYLGILLYQDPHAGNGEVLDDDAPTIIKVAKRRGGKTGKYGMIFKKTQQRFQE